MHTDREDLPESIRTEQLIQALARVTGARTGQLKTLLFERVQDNAGDTFAAIVDFLDDCLKTKKNERRSRE